MLPLLVEHVEHKTHTSEGDKSLVLQLFVERSLKL